MQAVSIQEKLVDLADHARGTDIRHFEDKETGHLLEELVPKILEILRETKKFLHELSDLYEPDNEPVDYENSGAFYRLVDRLVSAEVANEHLADLAFMGGAELRAMLESFERLTRRIETPNLDNDDNDDNDDKLRRDEILSLCFRGKRKIVKITTAIENTLAREMELEPRLDFRTELEAALEIRTAYAKMRHAVLSGREPKDLDTLKPRLVTACTAMAKLRGRDAYWSMRYGDRIELRCLQGRLLDWLREADTDKVEEGLHLWQDIAGFTRLLNEVNLRSELRENDRQIAEKLQARLTGSIPGPERIPQDLHDDLDKLYGCDEEIERLLDTACFDTDAWREPLNRLLAKFHQPISDHGGGPIPDSEENRVHPDFINASVH